MPGVPSGGPIGAEDGAGVAAGFGVAGAGSGGYRRPSTASHHPRSSGGAGNGMRGDDCILRCSARRRGCWGVFVIMCMLRW